MTKTQTAQHNTIPYLIELAYTNWDNADLLGRIGTELESRTRLDAARRILERALFLSPLQHPEWYLSLAFAHFRDTSGNYSADGERILVDGIEETDSDYLKASYLSMFESEDVGELIEELRASEDVSVRFALGHSLLWRGDRESAYTLLCRTVAELGEGDAPLGLESYCGAMNWMRGQGMEIDLHEEVLPYLDRLIRFAPDTYNFRALQIQSFQTLRDYERVCTVARATLEQFPDEETTMLALASAHEKCGREQEAIAWYNRAIGAKPSFTRARVMLGKLYEKRGESSLAEQTFREISTANPEYNLGKLEIAYFLKRAGKNNEAQSLFRYAYDRLKTFEKAAVEQHPEGSIFVREMLSLDLPILSN
jgi:tetratricopeptide (TPR) repeat protein